jgi:hypothetical protein
VYHEVPKITNFKRPNENKRYIHYENQVPYNNRRLKQQQFYRNQNANNRQYDYVNKNQPQPIPRQAYVNQNMMNYYVQPNYQQQQQLPPQQQQGQIYNPYYQQNYQNPYYYQNF